MGDCVSSKESVAVQKIASASSKESVGAKEEWEGADDASGEGGPGSGTGTGAGLGGAVLGRRTHQS